MRKSDKRWVELRKEYGIWLSGERTEASQGNSEAITSGKAPIDREILHFTGAELMCPNGLQAVLGVFGKAVGSASPIVQASLFSKYYSRMVAAGGLCAMSLFDRGLDLAFDQIALETDEGWSPILRLSKENDAQSSIYDSKNDNREKWREGVIRSIFAQHLCPIFENLTALTRVDPLLLWANTSYSVYWFYDRWIVEAPSEKARLEIKEDFQFVTEEAKESLFGVSKKNPLNLDYLIVPHPTEPSQLLRVRHQCCLRFTLPEASCCSICPRVHSNRNEEEAISLRQE